MARLSGQRHGVTVCNGAAVSDVVKREPPMLRWTRNGTGLAGNLTGGKAF
jgi:hypothetical protein